MEGFENPSHAGPTVCGPITVLPAGERGQPRITKGAKKSARTAGRQFVTAAFWVFTLWFSGIGTILSMKGRSY